VRRLDRRRPVAHRLAYRLLERPPPDVDRVQLRAVDPHAEDVRPLAVDVATPHVDLTGHVEVGGGHRGRGAVLARPGLGDDPLFAHVLREQHLPEGVVELVCAAVE